MKLTKRLLQESPLVDTKKIHEAVNRATFLAQEAGTLKRDFDPLVSECSKLWQEMAQHGYIPKNHEVMTSEMIKVIQKGNAALTILRDSLHDIAIIIKKAK